MKSKIFNAKSTQTFLMEYGDKTFDEFPFCDGDAFVLCEIFYMPFEDVAPTSFEEAPMDFTVAAYNLFSERGSKHKGNGVVLFTKQPSKNMMRMTGMRRYAGMKIAAVKYEFSKSPAVQFCCGTFLLPNGTVLVNFRGTDDTVAGWKEDFDIILTNGTPSHKKAVEYVNNAAKTFNGDIIIVGHSKGGNLALYSALNCNEEARSRIKGVYNNDGPGFYDHNYLESEEYKALIPYYHHFIPTNDFVGKCLANDYDYNVVKSSVRFPALQHYIGTWQLKDGQAVTVEDCSKFSKIFDIWSSELAGKIEDGYCDVVEEVFDAVSIGFGKDTLSDVIKHPKGVIAGGKAAWESLDPETKKDFSEAFGGSLVSLKNTVKSFSSEMTSEEVIKTSQESFAKSQA